MSCEHLTMSYSTFSKTKNDALKEPMFFGQPVNVARYDQQKYEVFEKLIEKQLSFFWRPEEIDVSRDRIDYANLPEHEKHIFISNLKYKPCSILSKAAARMLRSCLWCQFPSWKRGLKRGASAKPSTRAATLISSAIS